MSGSGPSGPDGLSPAARALLARRLAVSQKADTPPPHAAPNRGTLSSGQRAVWFFEQLAPGTAVYHLPKEIRLRGDLDVVALQQALDAVVARHEILRTRYEPAEPPAQYVLPPATVPLEIFDLADVSPEAQQERLRSRTRKQTLAPFDLARGECLRATLFRLAPRDHLLHLVLHHIGFDGWSTGVLLRDVAACYNAAAGNGACPPVLPLQYADYAAAEAAWLQGEEARRQLAFWVDALSNTPPESGLPPARQRPAERSYAADRLTRTLSRTLVEGVRQLASVSMATPFMVLLTAFQALLARHSGADVVVVGAPAANRTREREGLIGHFVNMLPLSLDVSGDPTFSELLERARVSVLTALAHQPVPFDRVVAELQPARVAGATPVFQTIFNFRNLPPAMPDFAGLQAEARAGFQGCSLLDLGLEVTETSEGFQCELTWATELFEQAAADRFLCGFEEFLAAAVREPDRPIGELLLVSAEDRRILEQWNETGRSFPDASIPELFSGQAGLCPGAIAVADDDGTLTYAALEAESDRLARRLLAAGAMRGEAVGVCMGRSRHLAVALLGVLKAGGCYVPLDPEYPAARLQLMIEDAGIRRVVTAGALPEGLLAGVAVVELASSPAAEESVHMPLPSVDSGDLAYIIYTSGSTGRPKGVAIPHRGVVRLVRNTDYVALGPETVMAQAATPSFDAATFEIWGALLNGGRLVVIPRETLLSPAELGRVLREKGITTLFLTTALFNQVARYEPRAFGTLRELFFGGETSDARAARRVLESGAPPARLLHVYGPTENTTFSTWHLVEAVPAGAATLPIGRPVANSTAHVLDGKGRLLPVGAWGELYVGGEGVARGYVGAAANDRFVADPYSSGVAGQLFRTGDRARWNAEGELEFGGRLDDQVKLRGFRIEPGEIEAALRRHPGVSDAAVIVREHEGEPRLVAYVGGAAGLTAHALRERLRSVLPGFMVPAAFVLLEKLPLTANGKLDRTALPGPPGMAASRTPDADSSLEMRVARIWCDLLGLDHIDVADNFFDLGGHSLSALAMLERVKAETGVSVSPAAFFRDPTIARLARVPEDASRGQDELIIEVEAGSPGIAPFFLFHGEIFGGGVYARTLAEVLGPDRPLFQIGPHLPSGPRTIEAMADDILPRLRAIAGGGPYLLGGFCNGGLVAFEVAQRLAAGGEAIRLLALIDVAPNNVGVGLLHAAVGLGRYLGLSAPMRRRILRRLSGPAERLADRLAEPHGAAPQLLAKVAAIFRWLWQELTSPARAVADWARSLRTPAQRRLREALGNAPAMALPEAFVRWAIGEARRMRRRVRDSLGPESDVVLHQRNFELAMKDYVPRRYPNALVLLVPDAAPAEARNRQVIRWSRLAAHVDVRIVRGDHFSLRGVHAAYLGRVLAELMAEAEDPAGTRRSAPSAAGP